VASNSQITATAYTNTELPITAGCKCDTKHKLQLQSYQQWSDAVTLKVSGKNNRNIKKLLELQRTANQWQ